MQRAALDFQKRRFDAACLTLTGDVASQAILLASARAQIDAVQTLLADDRKNLELVRMAHLDGSVTQIDVALAETQLSQTLLPPLAQQVTRRGMRCRSWPERARPTGWRRTSI